MAVGPKEDPAAFWNNIHLKPHTRWLLLEFALVVCWFCVVSLVSAVLFIKNSAPAAGYGVAIVPLLVF